MKFIQIIQNGGSKMSDASTPLPVSFLVINDIIVTSLLLLKVIYMLANFLIVFLKTPFYLSIFA